MARLDCATAFQRIALGCIANIKAHHGSACAGDAEAVHQIRMAITRLRAAVSFFAPMTVDAVWPRIKREIAWLNASLSAARDSDVVILYAQRKRYRAWTGQAGQQSLDQRRIQDHRRLARSLRSGRFQRFMKALLRWIESGPWLVGSARNARDERAEPLQAYSEWKLKHWHRRLVRKGHDLKTMEASRRHRLRIKVKRYRYMLEALMENLPSRRHAKIRHAQRAAKRLQGGLGDLRDLQRFGHVAAALSGEPGNGCPPGYAEQRRELLVEVVTACRSLKKTRPY
nr:CHAD domain-containing protein [Bradyrhizobium canariense]